LGQVLQVSEPFQVFADQKAYMIFADTFFHGVVTFSAIFGFCTNNPGRQLSRLGVDFTPEFQSAGVLKQ
jgi:xanthine/uracil permease